MWDTKLMALQFHCTTLLHFKATGHGSVQVNYSFISCVEIYELTVYNCFASNLRGLLAIFALQSHQNHTSMTHLSLACLPEILLSGSFPGIAQAEPNT